MRVHPADKSLKRFRDVLKVHNGKPQGFFQQRLMLVEAEPYRLLTAQFAETVDATVADLTNVFESLKQRVKRG